MSGLIRIRGARQHNLKNLDLDLRTGELTVVTGPSGSGKSSLVFDTLYAEGQRRYVETFSAYARQFLDRMDRPAVDAVEGVPPAIAIDQSNPVRTSRSTVGTMTELNDHLKLLFARKAQLFDADTAQAVREDDPESIYADLQARCAQAGDPRLVLTFPVELPADTSPEQVEQWLAASGYTRIHAERTVATLTGPRKLLDVVADRFRLGNAEKIRVIEALEAALKHGGGRCHVYAEDTLWRYSQGLHCPGSERHYSAPQPAMFSFNSAYGACETCRGFGRVVGVDFGLVIPDVRKSLRNGAIKPLQTPAWAECQDDLLRYAGEAGIPRDNAWAQLTPAQQAWVIDGAPDWQGDWKKHWYGIRRFFEYLESKAYKMHIRVLLSKYRSYTPCTVCAGARLKLEPLLWRLGSKAQADAVLPAAQRFLPQGTGWSRAQLEALPGLGLHDLMLLPIERLHRFFAASASTAAADPLHRLQEEIRTRLKYLGDVGLGYLTLDRQSRTLSGGEVQRINLTTALGTSLVNTLFVLDEPSIGLHPRDMHRINGAMLRLRDAGNTLVVVEHDPAVMLAADRIIDLGPGPGTQGGRIVFDGTPEDLKAAETLTGAYLGARRTIGLGLSRLVQNGPQSDTPRLRLEGVREHNLQNIDVTLPLQRLVCITGVSGSGKSTLIQDVLYPALARHFGQATESPGLHDRLLGTEALSAAVMVDQSPIGKTARSNPASFVGAFDAIRELFAHLPTAQQRGYSAGMFSFNAGDGRCPSCGGTGFEHVEMQFLSDVYLRCPDCDGTRYRAEIRDITLTRLGKALSIADVLELTVADAVRLFGQDREVVRTLQPLVDVGLDYVKLGQPVPTLSGGEAQRLKLASFLTEAAVKPPARAGKAKAALPKKGTLFLFDEPTTGLHFDDIAKLMRSFAKLLEAGHSLLVIEHNLDVIRAADWIVDLGPEGGDAGGLLVTEGTPDDLRAHPTSHTGQALREYEGSLGVKEAPNALQRALSPALSPKGRGSENLGAIQIINAREHNLQGIDVNIPRGKFTVITGVSGSGKSTLAFDILFNEGQRRYLESLNAYARSIVQPAGRPEVDAVWGIPPTVAIEQRLSRGGRKSTVATATEVWHFLRLLYVKLGTQYCPACSDFHAPPEAWLAVRPQTPESIAAQLLREHRGQHIGLLAPLVVNRKGLYTDLAKWAKGKGYAQLRVDGDFVATDAWPKLDRYKEHTVELPVAELLIDVAHEAALRAALAETLEHGQGVLHLLTPLKSAQSAKAVAESVAAGFMSKAFRSKATVFSIKRACPACGTSYPELDPRMFSYNSKHGWCPDCVGTGLALSREQRKVLDDSVRDDADKGREKSFAEPEVEALSDAPCPSCAGTRLNPIARAVRWRASSAPEVAALSVQEAARWLSRQKLDGREAAIARDVVSEIKSRLSFLSDVGLGYLTLDRAAPTLSGGEAQRIRLAAQLGSALQGVCYVLDEPTIGLHPRDNQILLDALHTLGAAGNTLVVVEHDEDTIRRADHIIDIGPGAGRRGGRIMAEGTALELMRHPDSITGRFLNAPLKHPLQPRRPVTPSTPKLVVGGASLHNLQQVDAEVPLGRLVAVTGVSGSGKSTLARDVLLSNVASHVSRKSEILRAIGQGGAPHALLALHGCTKLEGWSALDRVLEVDQTPIGKTPRSCPATYIGFWDPIRKLFAETLEAKARGYAAGRFSFNTGEGRCSGCEGQGMRTIEMSFLPDVKVGCELCHGARFNPETLAVRWRGKSIGEVLQMDVDEAVEFFAAMPAIAHPLKLLQDVGLGYLTLGQPSPTLSGGEAQRIKLVTELSKVRDDVTRRGQKAPHTLYVLDEPTVGLHMADVEKLIRVLHRLVDGGHSVVVIEHDLDVIAEADWIIDLGPDGGSGGGRVVVAGPPEAVVQKKSPTGVALKAVLGR
ncbi:MAG: excinuclease ABC subunit UvrA [Leptothrix ochracea]|uniref:excinuclease ABC subunit UvrA n=1 Tax=Leptothrix ochracea TaxID=735331 RepID=UPI0034E1BC0B